MAEGLSDDIRRMRQIPALAEIMQRHPKLAHLSTDEVADLLTALVEALDDYRRSVRH